MEVNTVNEKNVLNKFEENKLLNDIKDHEQLFIEFVNQRLGISVSHCQVDELRKAIFIGCRKFQCSPQEYLDALKKLNDRSPLLEHLIASVTVGETYFFRDKQQMDLLEQILLPTLIAKKRKDKDLSLRIWSAGCATGEEIYTIAILLNELIPDISAWTLNLLGTDINPESLKKAIAGRYSEWSMRSISNEYKNRYFVKNANQYEIANNIRNLVKFDYLNLNDDSYPSIFNGTNAQDLILCRNVLIYFNALCIHRLMQKLSVSITTDGYLLLGASDPIDIKDTNLIFHQGKGMLFSHVPSEKPSPSSIIKPAVEIKETKKVADVIPSVRPASKPYQAPKVSTSIDEQLIRKFINENEWQKALDAIKKYDIYLDKSAFLLSSKANVLANLGNLTEAENLIKKSLLIDSTNKYTYFTYALILIELNNVHEAEKMLRKSLFLDHEFVIAYYQLGLLLLRNKQELLGLKSLRNALSIVKTKNASESIQGSQGLNYGRLAEILQYELTLYTESGAYNGNKESIKQK